MNADFFSSRSERRRESDGMIRVRGANENNLKHADLDLPRDSLVVFTGVSGSGKSSLAFGTLYAEAQRRYLESVAPYARRLIQQAGAPQVESIEGLPPAVGLQQQRSVPQERSTVGSLTAVSNVLRMLYARAGDYPDGQAVLYAEDFSPNTPQGACPECQGLGRIYDATEESMVPDPELSIRQRAIAAWPGAWHGQNLRDILISLGYDVDKPWKDLPQKDRDWILFTEEKPSAPVFPDLSYEEIREAVRSGRRPDYMGNYTGARRQLLNMYASADTPGRRQRLEPYLAVRPCPACEGKRLKREALSVTFAGLDIAELFRLPVAELREKLEEGVRLHRADSTKKKSAEGHERETEKAQVAKRLVDDVSSRLERLIAIGVGHLSLDRPAPTLSSGELQRLRLATQLISKLFGVAYVLDEPSAGLHPADGEALLESLAALRDAGNSVLVVEHNLDVIKHAEWLVDIGPEAGERGGRVLYSGPPEGLESVEESITRRYLFAQAPSVLRETRQPEGWLKIRQLSFNNLNELDVDIPLGCLTAVTGVSGSGKSSLVSTALPALLSSRLGDLPADSEEEEEESQSREVSGKISGDLDSLRRLVRIDQKPIGRTPRSNLATYTGLFDHVRKLFANVPLSRERGYKAGRFSFNVAAGRCPNCEGQGFVQIELMFLSSLYVPCPECGGARYNPETLEVHWNDLNVADVLGLTVEQAAEVFAEQQAIFRPLSVLLDLGLGYLKLGQPATELSGGESQRIKLASELQRTQRGRTLYLLDEPTNGLHPIDADRLLRHLDALAKAGHAVVMVEHNMRIAAQSDWIIDLGPGAAAQGGKIVAAGTPREVSENKESRTAPYLAPHLVSGIAPNTD